jgi:hypothetical protein
MSDVRTALFVDLTTSWLAGSSDYAAEDAG